MELGLGITTVLQNSWRGRSSSLHFGLWQQTTPWALISQDEFLTGLNGLAANAIKILGIKWSTNKTS